MTRVTVNDFISSTLKVVGYQGRTWAAAAWFMQVCVPFFVRSRTFRPGSNRSYVDSTFSLKRVYGIFPTASPSTVANTVSAVSNVLH